MLKVILFLIFVATALAGYYGGKDGRASGNLHDWWHLSDFKEPTKESSKNVPFPNCLLSGSNSKYLRDLDLQKLFDQAVDAEEQLDYEESYTNVRKNYNDQIVDDDDDDRRASKSKKLIAAKAAVKLSSSILKKLACSLNSTDADELENLLNKFRLAGDFCQPKEKVDCSEKSEFRMPSGLCNNLEHPYEGNSFTPFARLKPADYNDYVSEPRKNSRRGGPLPNCRRVSLAFGSTPTFDAHFNNFFVGYGQFAAHDIALSVPVTDLHYTPVSTCTCDSKNDWNKCTTIDIPADDPFLRGQKCMTFPATAQAFKDDICSLGIKEQLNGDTHFLDLSTLYGNTVKTADILRGKDGLLKSTRRFGTKYELPPAQREGRSCQYDGSDNYCFAGGDSRLMITLLFTSIQTMFLRSHNTMARVIHDDLHPNWIGLKVYENARLINIALFQKYFYENWLQILFGEKIHNKYFPILKADEFSDYNSSVKPVVYNEVATAAFRLHTLIRDLFTRCTRDAKRIDQLWLTEILHKSKYAYDQKNGGLDSLLRGSLYDYGFAFDSNFAHQIHHRMFESTNKYGNVWRHDLVTMNICRAREHGIPPYNVFRKYCGLKKADTFDNLAPEINYIGIQKLKALYKDPDDIDLFVALNFEDPVDGGLVGPVTQCLLIKQFQDLMTGDRFFYTHKNALTHAQRVYVENLSLTCFICLTIDIEEVPKNPFVAPTSEEQLHKCDECKQFSADALRPVFAGDDASGDDS